MLSAAAAAALSPKVSSLSVMGNLLLQYISREVCH